jgi:hypothetical protein
MYRLDPSRLVFLHLAGKRRMRAAESKLPPKPILKLLQNMAKGAKGQVTINMVKAAFGAMKKWELFNSTTVSAESYPVGILKEWIEGGKSRGLVEDAYYTQIKFAKGVTESQANKFLGEVKNHATITKTRPKSGENGQIFIKAPTAPSSWEDSKAGRNYSGGNTDELRKIHEGHLMSHIDKAWVVVEGLGIKAPNGSEVKFIYPESYRGDDKLMTLGKLWTWGYKNGLKESAIEALAAMDQDELAYETAPKSQKHMVRRERSKEVDALLKKVVDSKFRDAVKYFTEDGLEAITRFKKIHDDFIRAEKKKGNKWPKYDKYNYYKQHRGEEQFDQLLGDAFEREKDGIYKRKNNWKKVAKDWGQHTAEMGREQFLYKNSTKLSRIVNGKGNLDKAMILRINSGPYDYGGELKFEFEDDSSFIVRNKTIFKRSHLGTPFYQFPTTFHNVALPDGSKMSGVNEKTMLEVFADVSATGR